MTQTQLQIDSFEAKFTKFYTYIELNPIETQLATQAHNGPDN